MTTPPTIPDPRAFAREVLAEAYCALRAQRNLARDWLAGVWQGLPPVAKLRMMAASLRGLSERVDAVAARVEEYERG